MIDSMIVAVTGLAREARLISRPDIHTVVGGGDTQALAQRIHEAIANGARRVMSIGICGAISPALDVGDCIVATEIVTRNERLPTHAPWTKELLEAIPQARPAPLAGTDTILASGSEKSSLYRETNAAAADMESHIAARVAREARLPFAAIRVVSDSSTRALPHAALVAMSTTGDVDIKAVLRSLIARPGQIPALIRTAWEAEKAFRVLFRCRHVLDPGFASPNLRELPLDVR